MRKISLSVLAAAGLVMTSCSSDEPLVGGNGYEDGKVSFSVALPSSIGSRAMADGLSAQELTYAVYDDSNNFLFQENVGNVFSGREANVLIPLVNGKTYKVAFFAKNENAPYTITSGNLSINYSGAVANDDIYDAFYTVQEVSVYAGMEQQEVVLKRPFGQLNVGATDWADAKQAGFTVEKTALSFTADVYTEMNLLNGEVDGLETVTFGFNTLPDVAADSTPAKLTVSDTDYDYVASAYVLMPTDQTVVNTVTFTYAGPQGNVDIPVNTVPMQRNYRTNIVGKFFTSDVKHHIVIDQNFETPDLEPAMLVEANELKAAIENASSGAIIAVKAGEITSQLVGLDASKVNGKDITIIGASEYGTYVDFTNVSQSGEGRLIYLNGLGDIVFKNIKFHIPSTINSYVGLCRASSVVYDNCLIEGVFFGYIEKETFLGCTFNTAANAYPFWTYGAKDITMESCVFNNSEKGKNILVYGDSGDLTVKLTLNNCSFNTGATSGDKCAVEIHTELGSNGTLVINGCTVSGAGWNSENGGLWREVNNNKGQNGEPTFKFDVYVDGVNVQVPLTVGSAGEYIVNTPLAFKQVLTNIGSLATAPVVLDIQGDIDMSGVTIQNGTDNSKQVSIAKHITLNGNGHTISNMEVSGLQATLFPYTSHGFTVSDLTVKNSKFIGVNQDNAYSCAAVFGAFCDVSKVKVTNCTIDGVTVGNAKYVGGFVAYCSSSASEFENCVVKNSKFINDYNEEGVYKGHCGGIIGATYGAAMTNCVVKDNIFNVNGDRNGIFSGSLWNSGVTGTGSASGNTGLSNYSGSVNSNLFTAAIN